MSFQKITVTVFESVENDGSDALSHTFYGFVDFCGKRSEFFCFFSVTPACNEISRSPIPPF
jgi:hypothetical protein